MRKAAMAALLCAVLAGCNRSGDEATTGFSPTVLSPDATPPQGGANLNLTFNLTPSNDWEPGASLVLYADARRNPNMGQEDVFGAVRYPGTYPRSTTQQLSFTIPGAQPGETVLVQGYMCSDQTSDCYPSDKDNPPSCAAQVPILPDLRPACQPVFTWTGGQSNGAVICTAACL
jgi:hypothetical protein